MKEKGRNSQDQINKEEIGNLPERELTHTHTHTLTHTHTQ